ncbi:hypothetical protein [Bradyrhizobium sp. STM 3557]|uniref:hypothetical protein n=1 Tax=Bradyrhizobium sp. STM 3557 TaxID=578920 RepID=UPI00388FBE7F
MNPIVHSDFIVRGDVLDAHKEAYAILADARAKAEQVRAEMDAERDRIFEEARRQGLRQGITEAAAIIINTRQTMDAFWVEREGELTELVFAVAHRIIGSLPADEVLVRLASEAIAEHAANVQLTLRAAPETAVLLRDALTSSPQGCRVTVQVDANAAPGECSLVHKNGRTELGLLGQFRAMMNGLPNDRSNVEPQG